MRLIWINEHAAGVGGAERALFDAAGQLAAAGCENHLLYSAGGTLEAGFTQGFVGAYPIVDLPAQVEALRPAIVYAHRVPGIALAEGLAGLSVPVIRFHHDHELFCLRRHKYTTIGAHTCSRRTSAMACYPCLGFLGPGRGALPISFRRLGPLHAEQAANRRFAGHVVASHYLREHLIEHDFPAERIHVLPPGITLPDVAPAVETGPVLFVGQLVRGKGVDILLAALARLPGVTAEIVGSGGQADELKSTARHLGLAERVRFLGHCDGSALAAAWNRAALVAVPSRAPETFNLVGIEALARGIPVVATAVGGMGEWLRDGVTGIAVPANDPGALAAAITRMRADPAQGRRFALAGRDIVAAKFTCAAHRDGLLTLFRSIAPEPRR